jgi:Zn-dependent peptidase ImmA (M78 family)/transcriptional regulator with XRE-family HTH domain
VPLDLPLLGRKLKAYRDQFEAPLEQVAAATGLPADRLAALEGGVQTPTGDEILILADYYKCDYNYFLSGDEPAVFEQTQELYRTHGDQFSSEDRWAVQEFLYLCECEHFLWQALERPPPTEFSFTEAGNHYKRGGAAAAKALRHFMGYQPNQVVKDVFRDCRSIGLHVFRRRLGNSRISGLCVRHPQAGSCLLVNYSEDMFRQRFTAAHEAAHAILDRDQSVTVSFEDGPDRREWRANAFASGYLVPPDTLALLPHDLSWTPETVTEWGIRFGVNSEPLLIALKDIGRISDHQYAVLRRVQIPQRVKADPELPDSLSPNASRRVRGMLERGLSLAYVALCFEAYDEGIVSAARLAEMLLADSGQVADIAALYGRVLRHEL